MKNLFSISSSVPVLVLFSGRYRELSTEIEPIRTEDSLQSYNNYSLTGRISQLCPQSLQSYRSVRITSRITHVETHVRKLTLIQDSFYIKILDPLEAFGDGSIKWCICNEEQKLLQWKGRLLISVRHSASYPQKCVFSALLFSPDCCPVEPA